MSPAESADRTMQGSRSSCLLTDTGSAGAAAYNTAQPSPNDIQRAKARVLALVDNQPTDKPTFWDEVVNVAGNDLRTARKNDAQGWESLSDPEYLFHLSQHCKCGNQASGHDVQAARARVLALVDNQPTDKPTIWDEVVKVADNDLRTARKNDAQGWESLPASQYLFHLSQPSTHGYPPDWV